MLVISRRKGQRLVIQVGSEIVIVQVLSAQFDKASVGVLARDGTIALTEEKARHIGLEENISRLLDDDEECGVTYEEPFRAVPVG